MLQESAALPASMWAAFNSWFTPTVLFLLLNLVIGTIALTSTLKRHQQNNPNPDPNPPDIARSPSLLRRLKSINFHTHFRSTAEPLHLSDSDNLNQAQHLQAQSHYFFPEQGNLDDSSPPHHGHYSLFQHSPQEAAQTNFGGEEEKGADFDGAQEKMEVGSQACGDLTGGHFSRTKSDTEPASGKEPTKLPAKMGKSASLKSAFGHFKEEDMVVEEEERRRPATVREKGQHHHHEGDEGVDAKADDFINRFKEQLKLQRLDSVVRYRDMIGRASGNGGSH